VSESATRIVLTPAGPASDTGVFFQPGARVDPRAYAAILRPLAEAGHVVVIAKQPLGIAFLSVSAFDAARAEHEDLTRWVVGGHSLGGTVAATQADAADDDPDAPVVGLVLFASYPASDLSTSLRASVLSMQPPCPGCRPARRSCRSTGPSTRSSATTEPSPVTARPPSARTRRGPRSHVPPSPL